MITTILDFLRKHNYLLTAALILLTLTTLSLTLLPPEKLTPDVGLFQYDKLGHALMFGSWTFLLGLNRLIKVETTLSLLSLFLVGLIFGILVEIMQGILPVGREASPFDALADLVGCLAAVMMLRYIIRMTQPETLPREH